jgi:hypothetical protein
MRIKRVDSGYTARAEERKERLVALNLEGTDGESVMAITVLLFTIQDAWLSVFCCITDAHPHARADMC